MRRFPVLALILMFNACSDPSDKSNTNLGPSKLATMDQKDAKPKLTIGNLKGEKVVLLGNPHSGYLSKEPLIGGKPLGGGEMGIHPEGKPNVGLASAGYAGKMGSVINDTTEFKAELVSPGRYTITLDDSGERIETNGTTYICPVSLMQKIKTELEGKTFWAKGSFVLYQPGNAVLATPFISETGVEVQPLERLTVVSVEPGVIGGQILVRIKKEDGREAGLYVGTDFGGGIAFKGLFFPGKECGPTSLEWEINKFFYFADPVAQHPDWNAGTWEQIKKGEVAIGMNEEMVAASCGSRFYVLRFTATSAGPGQTSSEWVYSCCPNKDFVIENGKVTRYARGN